MSALTRRRSHNEHQETWRVFYDDVCIGTIGRRAGIPVGADQSGWYCGFYPMSHRGLHDEGTAPHFYKARADFAEAWLRLQPLVTDADFIEHRYHRASTAWKYRMRDMGCRLPTQTAKGWSRCFCGAAIVTAGVPDHIRAVHIDLN